jgi:hypothetical protein
MKLTTVVFSISMFAAGIASAASSSYTVTLFDPISVGSTQLKAGEYKVEMQGDKAVFRMAGKTVAELPATMGTSDKKYQYTSLSSKDSKLSEIDIAGTKSKILFAPEAEHAIGSK